MPFAEEARYFVESRLLQRDVNIVLESVNNTNFVGSIQFPKGNIAEALLREGFAKCVDWSMAFMKTGERNTFLFILVVFYREKCVIKFLFSVTNVKLEFLSLALFSV